MSVFVVIQTQFVNDRKGTFPENVLIGKKREDLRMFRGGKMGSRDTQPTALSIQDYNFKYFTCKKSDILYETAHGYGPDETLYTTEEETATSNKDLAYKLDPRKDYTQARSSNSEIKKSPHLHLILNPKSPILAPCTYDTPTKDVPHSASKSPTARNSSFSGAVLGSGILMNGRGDGLQRQSNNTLVRKWNAVEV
ncbi:hypothetical protein K435DRAFT_806553 [Dendrothele bispora CBS 962.96]|uniref:Uncharacterized protein n=1 Tax=Dendrothele bispora (strain CBS 962.96) TaxID=1314807 RepID=A0A4S8L7F9_DENBC|nr:hypothetical protein K435DRAFT_806553 [Dendrothele bispora CBS 962.96]